MRVCSEASDNLKVDSGFSAVALALQFLGIPADVEMLKRNYGKNDEITLVEQLVRATKIFPVKSRIIKTKIDRLQHIAPPSIAELNDGKFIVLGRANDNFIVVQDPLTPRSTIVALNDLEKKWSGHLILISRRTKLGDLSSTGFGIGWFISAIHKYRWILSEVLIVSFFLQLISLASPLFFQIVIDKVLSHRGLTTLDVLMVGLGFIYVFDAFLTGIRFYTFAHTTNRIDVELGARLFRHLFALPISYFQSRRVGDSVARVRELENIRQFLTSSSLTFVIDFSFISIFLLIMFWYSPQLTLIVVVTIPIFCLISLLVTPILRNRLNERFRRGAENQSLLVESVTGIETIKAMAIEPQIQRHWEEQLSAYVKASFRAQIIGTITTQIVTLVNKLGSVVILFLGAKLVINNKLTIGELVAFNMFANNISNPILRIASLWQDFQQARLSIDRLGDILNTQSEPSNISARNSLPIIKGDIRLEGVTFRFRADLPPVLSNISLSIPAGQIIGIVGSSGSGKSTLAKLVQRFYVPDTGRIFVDGYDLATIDPVWLRRQIGVVLQDNILFNRSVGENIALGEPSLPMSRIVAAATLAGAHDFITRLPNGYDTVVGERGTSLSGGQRQRLAIARALVTNPRILILDEATSALDYESEHIIHENMQAMAEGRTVLVIAHRLSAVRHAKRIITIEQGCLVEDGSHDELIDKNGRYAKLYRIQAGNYEE